MYSFWYVDHTSIKEFWKEKNCCLSLKSTIKDRLKVSLEKITFPMIFPNKTQRADWLCLLRAYCRCAQSSPVPPPQLLEEYFLETQPSLLGTLPWYLILSSSFQLLWWVYTLEGHLWWLSGKKSACNAGDTGWVPGLGRSPRGGLEALLNFCLENPMDWEVLWAIVHWVAKSNQTTEENEHSHTYTLESAPNTLKTTGDISRKYCDHPITSRFHLGSGQIA